MGASAVPPTDADLTMTDTIAEVAVLPPPEPTLSMPSLDPRVTREGSITLQTNAQPHIGGLLVATPKVRQNPEPVRQLFHLNHRSKSFSDNLNPGAGTEPSLAIQSPFIPNPTPPESMRGDDGEPLSGASTPELHMLSQPRMLLNSAGTCPNSSI